MSILDVNGNVGIGTINPRAKLDVFHKFTVDPYNTYPVDG